MTRDGGPIEDRGRIRIASQRAVGICQRGASQNAKDVRRGGKPEGATALPSGSGKNGGREEAGKEQPSQDSDLLIPLFSSVVCTGPQDVEHHHD